MAEIPPEKRGLCGFAPPHGGIGACPVPKCGAAGTRGWNANRTGIEFVDTDDDPETSVSGTLFVQDD